MTASNYLLHAEELARTFQAVSAHLNPGGYFIFDMNTIYGLAVYWQRFPYNLNQDTEDYLALMGTAYDYELDTAEVRFIMFEREGARWRASMKSTANAAIIWTTFC